MYNVDRGFISGVINNKILFRYFRETRPRYSPTTIIQSRECGVEAKINTQKAPATLQQPVNRITHTSYTCLEVRDDTRLVRVHEQTLFSSLLHFTWGCLRSSTLKKYNINASMTLLSTGLISLVPVQYLDARNYAPQPELVK